MQTEPKRIYTKSGEPFANRRAATLQKGVHARKGVETKLVEIEGGFVLEEITPDEAAKRPARVSMIKRNVLTAPQKKGWHRRFVNDVGDRVEIFMNSGWRIVTDDEVTIGDPRAGRATKHGSPHTRNVGQGVTAVLMEIEQELYDENQREKAKLISQSENAMMLQGKGEGSFGEVKIGTKRSL